MPFYNASPYLGAAIQSILNQHFTDYEFLLLDDASGDDSLHIASGFNDPRIRLTRHTENQGVVAARNTLLSQARGKYLAFFDADDLAVPEKFARQIEYLEAHPELSLLGSSVYLINGKGEKTGRWKLGCSSEKLRARMLFHNYLVNSAVVVRADAIRPFTFETGSDICEDYLMWWRVLKSHKGMNLPDFLCAYRQHPASLTGGGKEKLWACETRVHRFILNDIGLEPTEEELFLHRQLRQAAIAVRVASLPAIIHWIGKVAGAGQKAGLIGPVAARRIALNRWAKMMKHCLRRPGILLYGLLLLPKLIRMLIHPRPEK